MKLLASSLLLYLSLLLDDAQAVRFPLQGRMGGFGNAYGRTTSAMTRRASILGTPDLSNQGNMQYQTNVTLNGKEFHVLIDTGR